jgi:hypothetical protein
VISRTRSKQRWYGAGAPSTRTGTASSTAAFRPLLIWTLFLSLLTGAFAIAAPSAFAEDGLPPGVPVPAWAVGKYVHFTPPKSSLFAHGISPQIAGGPGETLHYFGGPVQHEPQLFVIFWGAGFEQGPPGGLELTDLRDFYLGLEENKGEPGLKSWQGIISQYFDNEGSGSRTAKVKRIWEDPSSPGQITNSKVEAVISELVKDEREKGVNPSFESQYIVLPQPGTSYSSFPEMSKNCGFHGVDGEGYSYSLVAYAGDVGCEGPVGALPETSGTAAHEFAEAATDPEIEEPGKNYTDHAAWQQVETGEEVADLCEEHPAEKPANDFWYAVKVWDDEGGNKCNLEDPPYSNPPAPSVTTGATTGILSKSATLEGNVNPNGPDTHYYFELGETTSYGRDTPAPPGNDAGYGTSPVPVSVGVSELAPGVKYHYRLVASSWAGTSYGEDKTFTTLFPPPETRIKPANELGPTIATLEGEVKAWPGATVHAYFEYGPTISYGSKTSEESMSAQTWSYFTRKLTGLAPKTTYHYRVVAYTNGGTTR